MSDWNLRRATNADRVAIMLLVAEGLSEFQAAPDPATSEADLVDIEQSYDATGGLLLVAEREGILGCGGLILLDEDTAKIRKMYVRGDKRGKGIGKAILHRLIEAARERGIKRIVLETMTAMTTAQGLYQSAGFREVEGKADSCRCDRVYELTLG